MKLHLLSVNVPLDEVDGDINHRINMLEELNRQRLDLGEFKDFHSIKTLEWDLITELYNTYITGKSIDHNASIISALCEFAPLEPYDTFLVYNVIPVFLDITTYRLKDELLFDPTLAEVELKYDTVYRKDDSLIMTFIYQL